MISEHIGKYLINIMDSYKRELERLKELKEAKSIREDNIAVIRKNTKSILARNNAVASYHRFTNNILLNDLYIQYIQFLNVWQHTILFKLKYKEKYEWQPAVGDLFKDEEVKMEFQPPVALREKSKHGKLEKKGFWESISEKYIFIPNRKGDYKIDINTVGQLIGSIYIKTDDIKTGVLENLVDHFLLD